MPLSDLRFRAAGRSSAARNFKTAKFSGVTHFADLARSLRDSGCIDLQHEEILRKRGGEPDLVQFEPPG